MNTIDNILAGLKENFDGPENQAELRVKFYYTKDGQCDVFLEDLTYGHDKFICVSDIGDVEYDVIEKLPQIVKEQGYYK